MARERMVQQQCAEAGCRDTRFYTYTSQREYAEIMRVQQRRPYQCTRHSRPDEVLRPGNLERARVLLASKVPSPVSGREWLDGLFWLAEGESTGSGFVFGPGFKAHADDFPDGARLVVTARVELPAHTEAED